MKKIHKELVVLFVIIFYITCIFGNQNKIYASTTNNYMVLVQQKDGSWKEYQDIIEKSITGNLMIKAKNISSALGFAYYKTKKGNFGIKRSSTRYNSYKINSKEYTYVNGTEKTPGVAANTAYNSKISKSNLCSLTTLNTLVYYKYFSSSSSKTYSDYSGVICISKYKVIPAQVPTANIKPTPKPTPTPMPEPTIISIEGVEFTVRESFLSVSKALSDWGGASKQWLELEKEVDGKIIESTNLIVGTNSIEFTHLGKGSNGILLTRTSKEYTLSISVKLTGSVLTEQNAAIVKGMIATISSKPVLVYNSIFESFTTNETHGINEQKYITIGDCKIKVEVKEGKIIYYIKEP